MLLSPQDFGPVHKDGVNDDSVTLNAFFAGFPGNGVGYLPAGVYAVGSTINIGNGSPTQRSTLNGFTYICEGSAAHEVGMMDAHSVIPRSGVIFKWIGEPGGTAVRFNGPMHGVQQIGAIQVLGQGVAGRGIQVLSLSNSDIPSLAAYDCTDTNIDMSVQPVVSIGGDSNGLGTAGLRIGALVAYSPNIPGSICVSLDGLRQPGGLDVTHCNFGLLKLGICRNNGTGLRLGYCDFNRIDSIVSTGYGGHTLGDASGIWADGGDVPFATPDLNFIGQAAVGHGLALRTTGAAGQNFIEHYSLNDGAAMPTGNGFSGRVRSSFAPHMDGLTFGSYSRPKISAVTTGDGIYFVATDGTVHIGSITRQVNDINIAGWDKVRSQPGAINGPSIGHTIYI